MATLYIVATPIGNLEDMTFRAVRVLKECAVVFCEDTRTTRVLLNRYDIKAATESFHAQSPLSKMDRIVELLDPIYRATDPDAPTLVLTYSFQVPALQALADVILGDAPPQGTLPVTIPGLYPAAHGLGFQPRKSRHHLKR